MLNSSHAEISKRTEECQVYFETMQTAPQKHILDYIKKIVSKKILLKIWWMFKPILFILVPVS